MTRKTKTEEENEVELYFEFMKKQFRKRESLPQKVDNLSPGSALKEPWRFRNIAKLIKWR